MKKGFLLLAVLGLFLVETGFSQGQYYSESRIGVRAGLNYSNIVNIHPNSKPRVGGLQLGVYGLFPVSNNDKFYFQPELNYSNQGEYDRDDATRRKQKVFVNYLNVPLQFKLYLTDVENGFFFTAGPYVGFKLSKNIKHFDDISTFVDKDSFKTFDLGGIAGIGYSLHRRYELSFRYSLGLISQVDNPDNVKGVGSRYNSVFNLGFAYIFD